MTWLMTCYVTSITSYFTFHRFNSTTVRWARWMLTYSTWISIARTPRDWRINVYINLCEMQSGWQRNEMATWRALQRYFNWLTLDEARHTHTHNLNDVEFLCYCIVSMCVWFIASGEYENLCLFRPSIAARTNHVAFHWLKPLHIAGCRRRNVLWCRQPFFMRRHLCAQRIISLKLFIRKVMNIGDLNNQLLLFIILEMMNRRSNSSMSRKIRRIEFNLAHTHL